MIPLFPRGRTLCRLAGDLSARVILALAVFAGPAHSDEWRPQALEEIKRDMYGPCYDQREHGYAEINARYDGLTDPLRRQIDTLDAANVQTQNFGPYTYGEADVIEERLDEIADLVVQVNDHEMLRIRELIDARRAFRACLLHMYKAQIVEVSLDRPGWVLVDSWPEISENQHDFYNNEIEASASVLTLSVSFSVPGQYGYSGGAECKATWGEMPKVMYPGDTISLSYQATTVGHDSRGGYHFGHGCQILWSVRRLNAAGNVVGSHGSRLPDCRAFIGGNAGPTAECSVTSEWTVPGGTPDDGLVKLVNASGGEGRASFAYKYVFRDGP